MVIPEKIVIKWIEETKAISPFTRNFVKWIYENGFFIGNHGGSDKNFEMSKKIDEFYEAGM